MKRTWKKAAAGLLALTLAAGSLPANTAVQDLFSGVVLTAHADDTLSGYCGDRQVNDGKNVTWKLENGVLTISGTGAMADYPVEDPEWYSYSDSIKSVVIENGVTSIGEYAFYECSNLISITIPGSVTSIGESAFCYCSSLTDITIPDSVTSIGTWAFAYCSSLTDITIPDSVTSIGTWAFAYCSSLTDITIPDSVTSIGGYAFYDCSSLTDVTIPDGVTSIGGYAFYNCSSLTDVTIPDGVTSIGDFAFYYCSSLKSVLMKGETPPQLGISVLTNTHSNLRIHVPAPSGNTYKNAWSTYAGKIVEYLVLTEEACYPVDSKGVNKVHVGFTVNVPEDCSLVDYGLIYYNSGNVIHTEHLTLENVGVSGIKKASYYSANITDKGYGVTAVGFIKLRDETGAEETYYTGELGGSFEAMTNAAKYVKLTKQENKAITSGGKQKVYVGFDANVPNGYTVEDYGLIYYNSGNVIHTEHLTLNNVGVCGINKAKYWGANITDNGFGVTAVGFVKIKDGIGNETVIYSEELGGSFSAISEATAAKAVKLTRQKNKAVVSGGKNKVYAGFSANVPEDYTVEDYGLIYYNSGTVITTPYLTLENVGICGIQQAKYWGANITDIGCGVACVGFVKVRDANGYVTTLYTEELGNSFAAVSEADAANAVTLTRQENKAVVSGGKNKVYAGFDANIADGYTVDDYGLIYYNSGTVIHTEHLTLDNVGICGISKAKYWGANITDIGYGVTCVGFVKVTDKNGYTTTLYTEELGNSFSALAEEAEANAADAVTFTRHKNEPVVSGGKNKVYVGFDADIPDDYTLEDYGLIYYNSGTVITTPYLTLENVGTCGISKAKFWSANITDNGFGVTCVGFVKVKDENGYVTTLYTEELGAMFSALSKPPRALSEYTPIVAANMSEYAPQEAMKKQDGIGYGTLRQGQYYSTVAKKNKPYNILLPEGYDESKKYPVLYVLHGYYENQDRMIIYGNGKMFTQELIGNAIASGDAKEMIVVFPYVFTSETLDEATGMNAENDAAYDAFEYDLIDCLMPHIAETYSVAAGKENTAITGFSMGGRESLNIGTKYTDQFGYVGSICAAPGAVPIFQWVREETAPFLIMMTAGSDDNVVYDAPADYHNEAAELNCPHVWHYVNGGYHGDNCIHAHLYNFVRAVFQA